MHDFAYLGAMSRTTALLGASLMAAALACVSHTIIPTNETSWKLKDEIPRRREQIVLVISPAFATPTPVEVESADGVRRRFVIGTSLQDITREYFEHAFARVVTSETIPAQARGAAFVVAPELSRFEVSASRWTGVHELEIALRAHVVSPDGGEPLGSYEGIGAEKVLGNDAALGIGTNWAMQRAVADLVGRLARELPPSRLTELQR